MKIHATTLPKGWYEVHAGRTREGDRLIDTDSGESRGVSVSTGSTVLSMKRNRFRVIRLKDWLGSDKAREQRRRPHKSP